MLSRGEGDELAFYALDPDRGTIEPLTRVRYPWDTRATSWRPGLDGRAVIVSHAHPGDYRIEVLDYASGALSPLEVPPRCDPDAAELGVDGEWFVACRSDGRFGWTLYRLSADGRAEVLLREPSGEIRQPLLSPDGRSLLLSLAPSTSNLFLLDAR